MQRIPVLGFIVLGASFPLISFADTPTTADEIVVTASRTAQTANQALASVSVITRKDIENSQAGSIVDLLQQYAGIDAVRSGGPGQQTSIFMRGTNSDHTLVLIDGMPVSSINTGSYQWENLSLNEVQRIEIVRGPRSALYGSEALGGVIQIFTRKNKHVTTDALAGSFDTYGADFSGSVGDKTKLYINASHKQAVGFSAKNSSSSYDYDPDNDGYNHNSVGVGLDSRINDRATFDAYAHKSDLDSDFDKGSSNTKQELVTARLNLTPSTTSSWRVSAGSYNDVLTTYDVSSDDSRITTHRDTAGVQTDRQLNSENLLILGLDYRVDHGINHDLATSSTVFDRTVNNTGTYLSWQKTRPSGSLELAARLDAHSQFGSHVTGQAAWGKNLARNRKLYVSLGTGFKAPDFNELYAPPSSYGYGGNDKLQPEESRSVEIGLKRSETGLKRTIDIFYNQIDNLIAYQGGSTHQAINISRALTYGLELAQTRQRGQWTFDSQLTLQRAIDESDGSALLRRPNEKLDFRITRKLAHNSSAMLETLLSGGALDYGPVKLGAYGVVNAVYNRQLNPGWRFSVRIDNLFDRKYEVAAGYNTTPRSLLVNLRYQPR